MPSLDQLMQEGRDFIAANLSQCCQDELSFQSSGLLESSKLREAKAIFAQVNPQYALAIAQAETARQAMRAVAQLGISSSQASDKLMRDKLTAALQKAQVGFGSHGPNYDGAKLAAAIQAVIQEGRQVRVEDGPDNT